MIDAIDQNYLDGLTHAQKDALILALCATIRDLTARVEALEAKSGKPKKTSKKLLIRSSKVLPISRC